LKKQKRSGVLSADTLSITFSFGGSRDDASGVLFLQGGCSTESGGGCSFATREFIALSWSGTAFNIDFFELALGVTA